MDSIKIRYTFRHKGSGNIEMKWYNIAQLEERAAAKLSPVFSDEYELISRDLYTGLKDKNSQEIYEGDVIEGFTSYKPFKAIVKFGHYKQDGSGGEYSPTECIGFYAEAINPDQKDEDDFDLIYDYDKKTSLFEFDSIEIIGDAYRNPDLLEAAE
ncbi:YopX family protein [Bacillus licheniformis]|uniref:YopX family protein n=1 Tax=Bacillus licheniformis TaxID=1402 RepID=UPI00047D87E4|nr:YopX family protein [Bacillus licheniformis]MCM3436821.1 YopX family protein [Bacillus licheniformis]MDE1440944.1 YopX family protein [Bacillus licheniformis]HWO96136.1 YopX family protein [Bacillus sp. (in: firmicutes)]